MLSYTLIYAGLVPFALATIVALVARRLRAAPQVALATGVAFGYIAAHFALKSQAGTAAAIQSIVNPIEAADWLPLVATMSWAVTLLLASGWRPARLVAVAVTFTVPLRLLASHARITREWSPSEKFGYLSLLAAVIGFVWLLLATEDEELPSSGRFPCIVAVAIGIAVALTLAGAFTYGQLSGAVAAALTGAALACFVGATGTATMTKRLLVPGFTGAAGVTACLLIGLILLGHFYAELSTSGAALLYAALLAASAPLPKPLADHPAWLHIAARSLLCLTPLAVAIGSLVGDSSPY